MQCCLGDLFNRMQAALSPTTPPTARIVYLLIRSIGDNRNLNGFRQDSVDPGVIYSTECR